MRPATPEDGLYISIDTWLMQLHDFTQQVMGLDVGEERQTYVAGNSLGGLLAVSMGAVGGEGNGKAGGTGGQGLRGKACLLLQTAV